MELQILTTFVLFFVTWLSIVTIPISNRDTSLYETLFVQRYYNALMVKLS